MQSSTKYQIGTAYRDLTPPYPVWLYGYGARDRKSDAVSEPIYIGCLNISTPSKTILIFTCDMLGIESAVCEDLYQLLKKETGIVFPDIIFSCSHTHFAPGVNSSEFTSPNLGIVEPDKRFIADFKIKIVEAAKESLRNTRHVQLETTRAAAPQALFNRRTVQRDGNVLTTFMYPEDAEKYTFSPTDQQLSVLRFVNDDGVQAMLVNFGCHPVTGGENHFAISADYPYYLRKRLAEWYHCPVFFSLGAAGDTVPINRYGNCRERVGELLANSVILAERTFTPENNVEIKSRVLTLPVRTIFDTDSHTAQTDLEKAKTELLALQKSSDADPESDSYRAIAENFYHKVIIFKRSLLYPDNAYKVNIQMIKIGKTALVTFPFEVLSEISLKMKARYPDSVLFSCSGGYQGYLPLKYEYDRGGYEASEWSTHFEKGTADRLLEAVLSSSFL